MQNIILNRTVFPPITSVILKLSVSGFFLHTIRKDRLKISRFLKKYLIFPPPKLQELSKKTPNIQNAIINIF